MTLRELPFHAFRKVIVATAAALFLVSAGEGAATWLSADGFRELPWGISVEQAKAVYPDLHFLRYSIGDEREVPSMVYERKNEEKRIDDTGVDEIRYWFRDDVFHKVTIHMASRVGPRTLMTRAEEAFDRFFLSIRGVAGEPDESSAQGTVSPGGRKASWHRGDLAVSLGVLDPPGANDEILRLEIERDPKSMKPRLREQGDR